MSMYVSSSSMSSSVEGTSQLPPSDEFPSLMNSLNGLDFNEIEELMTPYRNGENFDAMLQELYTNLLDDFTISLETKISVLNEMSQTSFHCRAAYLIFESRNSALFSSLLLYTPNKSIEICTYIQQHSEDWATKIWTDLWNISQQNVPLEVREEHCSNLCKHIPEEMYSELIKCINSNIDSFAFGLFISLCGKNSLTKACLIGYFTFKNPNCESKELFALLEGMASWKKQTHAVNVCFPHFISHISASYPVLNNIVDNLLTFSPSVQFSLLWTFPVATRTQILEKYKERSIYIADWLTFFIKNNSKLEYKFAFCKEFVSFILDNDLNEFYKHLASTKSIAIPYILLGIPLQRLNDLKKLSFETLYEVFDRVRFHQLPDGAELLGLLNADNDKLLEFERKKKTHGRNKPQNNRLHKLCTEFPIETSNHHPLTAQEISNYAICSLAELDQGDLGGDFQKVIDRTPCLFLTLGGIHSELKNNLIHLLGSLGNSQIKAFACTFGVDVDMQPYVVEEIEQFSARFRSDQMTALLSALQPSILTAFLTKLLNGLTNPCLELHQMTLEFNEICNRLNNSKNSPNNSEYKITYEEFMTKIKTISAFTKTHYFPSMLGVYKYLESYLTSHPNAAPHFVQTHVHLKYLAETYAYNWSELYSTYKPQIAPVSEIPLKCGEGILSQIKTSDLVRLGFRDESVLSTVGICSEKDFIVLGFQNDNKKEHLKIFTKFLNQSKNLPELWKRITVKSLSDAMPEFGKLTLSKLVEDVIVLPEHLFELEKVQGLS